MNLNIIEPDRAFLTFGDSDKEFYRGKLNYYSILSDFAIYIEFGWIKVRDGDEMNIATALLDTGNTCISIPRRF